MRRLLPLVLVVFAAMAVAVLLIGCTPDDRACTEQVTECGSSGCEPHCVAAE